MLLNILSSIEVLREIRPLTGSSRYVFPSARSTARPMSDNAILAAFRRMGIDKNEMSVHGFRAVARTMLDENLGFFFAFAICDVFATPVEEF